VPTLALVAEADAAATVGRAWLLFLVTAGVLGLALLLVMLLMLARRGRRAAAKPRRDDAAQVDAWEEAGRRAEAYPTDREE
jgi:membrane protein implicated in regulation of membrane protease activity